ncbi:putative transposase [Bacillus mycoides NBRC 101238 = DSM 11821]|nr:Transposase [Bacillus cereus BDRD-ST196]GAE42740.1 putative transposase [Bacillus mycoides NBRC 101238 = DSM 11821]
MNETYIKVKGQWIYLYRAVNSEGNTFDCYLSKSRNHKDAKRFFKKALRSFHVSKPRVITVNKNPTYPIVIEKLKKEKKMPAGFQNLRHASRTLKGIEAVHALYKQNRSLKPGFCI